MDQQQRDQLYLEAFRKALKTTPGKIHWPTPAEPWLSFPMELNLVTTVRRRQGVIQPAYPPPAPPAVE